MSRLATLKAAQSLSDLAVMLGFKPSAISFILYKQDIAAKYHTFHVPKRNGGRRTIHAPRDSLKALQRNTADLLQDCIDELQGMRQRKDRVAHGFKRGRSILTNARQHRHRRWVFNLDLEEFFPAINFGRVRGYLIRNRGFELHENVATVIAQIACHEGVLPQGSPCSPVISNLVAHVLDMRLVGLASAAGCTYSRYADDLTFSTNKSSFPADIAVASAPEGPGSHVWMPSKDLEQAIRRAGFRINDKKTHMMYRNSRQDVTGLVVNEKLSVRWQYRHHVRAMVHRLVTTGTFEIVGLRHDNGTPALVSRKGALDELHGMLGFIDNVARSNPTALHPSLSRTCSEEHVYRDFLLYKDFYAAQVPVVLCEGETDTVYLTHAIRALAREFPELASVTKEKIVLNIRLYKYPRSSTGRLLGLGDGGTSALNNFIAAYKRETARFTAPGLFNPVVIVYDNDDGAKRILSAVYQASKRKPTSTDRFVHVVKNLYVVPTPLAPGTTKSKIEDCFSDSVKAIEVDGKVFFDGNSLNTDTQYGKKIFAHRVVEARAQTIDFSGFRPLLIRLSDVIKEHRKSAGSLD